MIERNLHISLSLYGDDFILTRPITLVMLVLLIFTTALPFVRARRKKRAAERRIP
jgi:putative tricarboxylic transport membrane protein